MRLARTGALSDSCSRCGKPQRAGVARRAAHALSVRIIYGTFTTSLLGLRLALQLPQLQTESGAKLGQRPPAPGAPRLPKVDNQKLHPPAKQDNRWRSILRQGPAPAGCGHPPDRRVSTYRPGPHRINPGSHVDLWRWRNHSSWHAPGRCIPTRQLSTQFTSGPGLMLCPVPAGAWDACTVSGKMIRTPRVRVRGAATATESGSLCHRQDHG